MAGTLAHRGPDGAGTWLDAGAGIALGHRRLAVLDPSSAGAQPMVSTCGRHVIAFNGEIYNHLDLREALRLDAAAPEWRGHSDTETLLAAISRWGLRQTLTRCVGMFAFALWDREEQILSLARDRLGEKPLYYGWSGGAFLFGSELKALRAHPAWHGEIDRQALASLLRLGYIPGPHSIFQGFRKLPPGTLLQVTRSSLSTLPAPQRYWSLREVALGGATFPGDEKAAEQQAESLLRQAVRQQMVADVPLGVFLSGGVDSSLVAALMREEGTHPIRTFSIGFREDRYDEARHAREVANYLGTRHTELYVSAELAREAIPGLPRTYDEPFADPSQIPTLLLAQLARPHVTVSLTGDGGDEFFGGYDRYLWGPRIWALFRHLPLALRRSAAALLAAAPTAACSGLTAGRLHKLAAILPAADPAALYNALASRWDDAPEVVVGATRPQEEAGMADFKHLAQHMMYLDGMSFLPDDIMVKVDRACMSVGLESRAPFLDHRIAEFAWSLPPSMKIRNGDNKWLLRQILHRHVPRHLVDRPKKGFAVPLGEWLRGPLREWAEALLDERRLRAEGFFHPEPIRRKWLEHVSGRRNWQHALWHVLMFQAWLELETRRPP